MKTKYQHIADEASRGGFDFDGVATLKAMGITGFKVAKKECPLCENKGFYYAANEAGEDVEIECQNPEHYE